MEAKLDLVKNWLTIARRDLDSAERLAAGTDPYLDTAIYHCQQAAEKALKGWLVALAAEVEPRFQSWSDIADALTPYATAYRYPGERLAPEFQEFNQAFQSASNLYTFVISLLPLEFQPTG